MNTETNIQNPRSGFPTTFDKLFSERLGPSKLMAHRMKGDGARAHIKLRVQETLDELFNEHLVPFKLTAYEVTADGPDTYTIPFCDSRIYSISFFWRSNESFKEAVHAAVVERIKSLSFPCLLTPQPYHV